MEAVIRFKCPATYGLYGMTFSGKSSWVFNLLRYKDIMFEAPPYRIIYCYNMYQQSFDRLQEEFKDSIVMHEGIPSRQFLEGHADGRHFICILDDLQSKCNKKDSGVGELFCVGSHALNMSILLVGHSIFGKDQGVLINRNLHYIVLMRDNRDKRQIATLGSQLYPGQTDFFKKAYELSTAKQFGYLLISVHPQTERDYALSTSIFPNEPTIIYKPV